MANEPVRIIGLDPGLRRTGWGVIVSDGARLRWVAHGVVAPPEAAPFSERLLFLFDALGTICADHDCEEAAVEEVFVNVNPSSTLKLGHARAAVADAGFKPRVIATDLQLNLGPLGGIATALRSTRHSRVLFLGCDMPFLSGNLINEFLAAATYGIGPIFTRHKKGVGFPFVLHRSDLALVEKQIDRGALSLQRLAKRLKARAWQPPASRVPELFNINTPADLAEAKRRLKVAGC